MTGVQTCALPILNIKTRKLVPSPATLSPTNRQRAAQAYSTEDTRWISRLKFTVPREGRQSIPIENAGFSKQSDWSHAGSNKGEMPRQEPPPPQSVTVRPTAQDHLNHGKLIAVPLDLVIRGLHNTQSPQGHDATENIS